MNKGSFPEKLREIFKTNINKIFQKFFNKMCFSSVNKIFQKKNFQEMSKGDFLTKRVKVKFS